MPRRLPLKSKEEKIAEQIANITSDHRIDLDEVGRQVALMIPRTTYNRLLIIAESAEHEMENQIVRTTHLPLF
jgi:hypothetical protein